MVRWLSRLVVRFRILLLTAAVLLAAYAAAGFWLVPRLLSDLIRDTFHERYQRKVELGAISFNPFTFELQASDFAVPDADGAALLAFDRLYVNASMVSVFRGGPTLREIDLDKPRVRLVRRADGALNLSDFAGPDTPEEPAAAPPKLWIDDLKIREGQATIIDRDRPQPLTRELGPITFQVRQFSTQNEGNEYSLTVQAARGEELSWRGNFGLTPLASQGKFSLRNIQVPTLTEIAADLMPFQVTRGQLAAEGSYVFGGDNLRVDVAQLILDELGLRARGDAHDMLTVQHLSVMRTQLDLSERTLKVAHVTLDQLQVAAVRDSAGQLSLQRLLPKTPEPEPEPEPGSPWRIEAPDILLRAADLKFEDRRASDSAHFRLSPFELSIAGFTSPASGPLQLALKTGINETGRLETRGELHLDDLSGRFAIEASAIPLVPLQPYIDEAAGFNLKSGKAGFHGTLSVSAQRAVELDGRASVDDLKTTDKELEEDFVKWSRLELVGLNVQTQPQALRIAEIAVTEPYARVIVSPRGGTNIQDVLSPRTAAQPTAALVSAEPGPAAVSAEPQAAAPMPMEIELVRVDQGSMNFADLSLKPNFETGIQQLSGTIQGLSSRVDALADVQLAGQVDRYTPVKITGKVNYFAAVSYTDLHMAFRNLELTSMSPYSGKFAGYRIERGKLNVTLNYLVKKRKLHAKHKIIIDQLQLGDHVDSPDATGLPVKLAIALLKDRNGVIDLDIPVSGNLDDPKFKVWPIIWQVVVNLLTKIVTSPFALLGSLFGASEEISFVDFSSGSAALSAAGQGKLRTLAKALKERPALNLDLPLVVKPDVDGPALAEQYWRADRERHVRRRLGARASNADSIAKLIATPKEYRAVLESAYREAYGKKAVVPPPTAAAPQTAAVSSAPKAGAEAQVPDSVANTWLEQQLKAKIAIGQSDFEALARERAQKVQGIILEGTGIDPARVFVITAAPLTADAALRMQLALH
jgi:hypothetical protein